MMERGFFYCAVVLVRDVAWKSVCFKNAFGLLSRIDVGVLVGPGNGSIVINVGAKL